MIVAVGRLCIDEFFSLVNSSQRIGTTKKAAVLLGSRLGGSIYNCLKVASEWNVKCSLLTAASSSINELVEENSNSNLSLFIVEKETSAKSIILINDEKIESIISVNESQELKVSDGDVLNFIRGLDNQLVKNDIVITDLRHENAALQLAHYAHGLGSLVMLDPGSTIFYSKNGLNDKHRKIIEFCDVIIASSEFYLSVDHFNNFTEIFASPVFKNCKIGICTLNNGINLVATRDFSFSISRGGNVSIGNTMGAGDVFRGVFISLIHNAIQNKIEIGKNMLVEILKNCIAATTIKIEDKNVFPVFPDRQSVIERKENMSFIITDSQENMSLED